MKRFFCLCWFIAGCSAVDASRLALVNPALSPDLFLWTDACNV